MKLAIALSIFSLVFALAVPSLATERIVVAEMFTNTS